MNLITNFIRQSGISGVTANTSAPPVSGHSFAQFSVSGSVRGSQGSGGGSFAGAQNDCTSGGDSCRNGMGGSGPGTSTNSMIPEALVGSIDAAGPGTDQQKQLGSTCDPRCPC